MKCLKFYSLAIFLLIHLACASMAENHNTALSTRHKKHRKTNTEPTASTSLAKNLVNNQRKIQRTNVEKKDKDFFKKTSKSNTNMAWKALSGFVAGIVIFILSIHLTCWNERRAVKEVEFIDYVRDQRKCKLIEPGMEFESKPDGKIIHIVNGILAFKSIGPVTVIREAEIPNLNIDLHTNKGKILLVRTKIESFHKTSVIEYSPGVDEHGEEVEKEIEKEERNWLVVNSDKKSENLNDTIYRGEVDLILTLGFDR